MAFCVRHNATVPRAVGKEWKGKEWFSKDSLSPMKSDNDGIVIRREKTSNVNESGCCVSL